MKSILGGWVGGGLLLAKNCKASGLQSLVQCKMLQQKTFITKKHCCPKFWGARTPSHQPPGSNTIVKF